MQRFRAIARIDRRAFALLVASLVVSSIFMGNVAVAQRPVVDRLELLWGPFESTLAELAARYDEAGRRVDGDRLRNDIANGTSSVAYEPPSRSVKTELTNLPEPLASIWAEERALRSRYANDVYRLARSALLDGETTQGMHLLRHALAIDSDSDLVRRLLGYVEIDGQWKTVFEARMDREGLQWHDDFGWIPASHVARYEQGERFYRNRWMTSLDEAEFRQHFEYAWEVETEHFLVQTNVSLEMAARIAKRLETFYDYFYREFSSLFDSRQAAREFLKPATRRLTKKYKVHYYSTREEYVRRLAPKQRGVSISRGVYLPRDRTSYFFDDPELSNPLETLYHEVTHQLLFESDSRMREVADDGGYWAVEGLACYLESFVEPEEARRLGRPVAGDIDHERIYWARHRVLVEGFFIPMQQFDRLGMKLFQAARSEEDLRRRYSQSTGMTHFLLHYDDGRYRAGFLEYIARLYHPQSPTRPSLERFLGVPYSLLDRQYRDHLAAIEAKASVQAVRAEDQVGTP